MIISFKIAKTMSTQKTFIYRNIEFEPAYDLLTEKNRKALAHRVDTADLMKDFNYADFSNAAKCVQSADLYRCFYGLFLPLERYSKLISNYDELNDKVVVRILSSAKHLEQPKTEFEERFKIGFLGFFFIWDCKELKYIAKFPSLEEAKVFFETLKTAKP